ncbi:MAG: heat-inducible transcriptional repressor [Myxococcota bacterium]|jgi:heat-inducible transcriptional repressor
MERDRQILREIVEVHIATGEAVGSKTLAKRPGNRLSSASIRAVMHDLEERGLLAKRHTSGGRVPTDQGYRLYLDALFVPKRLRAPVVDQVAGLRWDEGRSAVDVIRQAAQSLSQTMGCASLIFTPRLESAILQELEFVALGRGRVLAIAVTRSGLVHERMLEVDDEPTRETLTELTNYLNTLLPGRTLAEVRRLLETTQAQAQAVRSAVETRALDLGRRAFEGHVDGGRAELVVDGTAQILASPEFTERPGIAADVVRALAQRETWLDLIDRVLAAQDIEVYVGAETGRHALASCGLVTGHYRAGGGRGVVMLLGPKRLDYRRAVPLVQMMRDRLTEVLETEQAA